MTGGRMRIKANRLGEMLLEAGLIDQFQLDSALSMQRNLGGRLGSALVKLGYLPEDTILEFLENQARFARVELTDLAIDPELLRLLPAERLWHLLIVPIEMRQTPSGRLLRIAMTDPTNLTLIEELQIATGTQVLPELAAEDEIRQALRKNLPQEDEFGLIDLHETPASGLSSADGLAETRLERLLELLQEKGLLSASEVERVKFGR